jgi:hypothetical protein
LILKEDHAGSIEEMIERGQSKEINSKTGRKKTTMEEFDDLLDYRTWLTHHFGAIKEGIGSYHCFEIRKLWQYRIPFARN